jgi:hypothetical protein
MFGIKMNELGSCPRRFILLQVITEIMSLVIIESCIVGMPTPFLFFFFSFEGSRLDFYEILMKRIVKEKLFS